MSDARFENPTKFEVTVYDTEKEKVVLDRQCLGYMIGEIKVIELEQEGDVHQYATVQPMGENFSAQDVAVLIFTLIEMYPEAQSYLDEMAEGNIGIGMVERGEDDDQIFLDDDDDE